MIVAFGLTTLIIFLVCTYTHYMTLWRLRGRRLPHGNAGFPIFGETFTLLFREKMFFDELNRRGRLGSNPKICMTHVLFSYVVMGWAPTLPSLLSVLEQQGRIRPSVGPAQRVVVGPISYLTAAQCHEIHRTLGTGLGSRVISRRFGTIMESTASFLSSLPASLDSASVKESLRRYSCDIVLSIIVGEVPKRAADYRELISFYEDALVSIPLDIPASAFRKGLQARKMLRRMLLEDVADHEQCLFRLFSERDHPYMRKTDVCDILIKSISYSTMMLPAALAGVLKYAGEEKTWVEEVRREIKTTRQQGKLDHFAVSRKMPLLDAFVVETLRLVSPQRMLAREVKEDLELLGFCVPKGWILGFSVIQANTDPEMWEDVSKFNPARFLQTASGVQVKQLDSENHTSVVRNGRIEKDGFCPFGFGRSQCPAQSLSLSVLKVFTIGLVDQFDVGLHGAHIECPAAVARMWKFDMELHRRCWGFDDAQSQAQRDGIVQETPRPSTVRHRATGQLSSINEEPDAAADDW